MCDRVSPGHHVALTRPRPAADTPRLATLPADKSGFRKYAGQFYQDDVMQPRVSCSSVSSPEDDILAYNFILTTCGPCATVTNVMNATQHILIVDDDMELRTLVSDVLVNNGFRVSAAEHGSAMTQVLATARVDLIILDILMPGEDGLSLCRRLRANGTIPIIMLTARASEFDRVLGLEMGADDYLPKPFSTRELLARVRAVLRRSAMPQPGSASGAGRVFEFSGWRLDVTRRELRSPAKALVVLRAAEYELLLALVERPQNVLSRDQLLDLARGRSADASDRSIDLLVSRLRHRIETDPKEPELIKTVRSGGYVFAAPVTLNGAPW
jgi:two-component system, OmpR family, response regulator